VLTTTKKITLSQLLTIEKSRVRLAPEGQTKIFFLPFFSSLFVGKFANKKTKLLVYGQAMAAKTRLSSLAQLEQPVLILASCVGLLKVVAIQGTLIMKINDL
jgi:hypothetical protein